MLRGLERKRRKRIQTEEEDRRHDGKRKTLGVSNIILRLCRDQELRFTVHDSPDYFQMKVSVFNDDKKTDLIGETWVNLQDVVVQGGGQSDIWHNLQCRGKYAGEIRIEITYYDTRPKHEKPVVERVKKENTVTAGGIDSPRDSLSGPRPAKSPVKRRPLPSDPITGESPSPVTTPDHSQSLPKGFNTPEKFVSTQSPLQAVEYNTSQRPKEPRYHDGHHSEQRREYRTQPQPKGQSHGQDTHHRHGSGAPPGTVAYAPASSTFTPHDETYQIHDAQDENIFDPRKSIGRQEVPAQYQGRQFPSRYEIQRDLYDTPVHDDYEQPSSPEGPPPPPPAHRSNHASPAATPLPHHTNSREKSDQVSRFAVHRHEPQRTSIPGYGSTSPYQAYSPPKEYGRTPTYDSPSVHQISPPRHHSYDERYTSNYAALQPSVEDAPPSPSQLRNSFNGLPQYEDRAAYDRSYNQVPSPAPLNLSGRGSALSGRQSAASIPTQTSYSSYPSSESPVSYRDPSYMNSDVSSRTTHSQQSVPSQYGQQSHRSRHSDEYDVSPGSCHIPQLPSTLVAGMDPMISQEISNRIYQDTRNGYIQQAITPPRGRYQEAPQQRQQYSHGYSHSEVIHATPSPGGYQDERQHRMSVSKHTPLVNPRAVSPNPATPGSIPRKSVSPAPLQNEQRRLSGVPFGPDAFDVLNPNLTPVKVSEQPSPYNTPGDPEAKIIMHDGREVDPSDHLPEHSWAPEPEVRTPKKQEPPRHRPSPSGAQPMPPSGRRPLRVAQGRPQSVAAPYSSPVYMSGAISDPSTPAPSAGRNKLQKKSNRQSAQPAPQSSPLAPINPYQDPSYNSRGLPRSHTTDFTGENGYSNGGAGYRGSIGPAPPPKIPMGGHSNSYGPPAPAPEESAWALLEEMKSIDLGNGKGRRKR